MFTGTLLVDGVAEIMGSLGSPEWLTVLVANGIGGGIPVVATFIPVIAFLYLFLSVLEDSGYMARGPFVMDRFMRAIGLPGNSLNTLSIDSSFGNEDSDKSLLSDVGRTIAPAFSPMGLDEENWPAAVGIFNGVLAKEAVVGTLDSMYTAFAEADAAAAGITEEQTPLSFWEGIFRAAHWMMSFTCQRWKRSTAQYRQLICLPYLGTSFHQIV